MIRSVFSYLYEKSCRLECKCNVERALLDDRPVSLMGVKGDGPPWTGEDSMLWGAAELLCCVFETSIRSCISNTKI